MAENKQYSIVEQFWQAMNLPDSCLLNSRVYKKMLLENAALRAIDKRVVNEDIDTLVWRYTLKPETINISGLQTEELDYPEIAVIHVTLRSQSRVKRLGELLQRIIPYPLILLFSLENRLWLSLANKRQSLAESEKLTVESIFNSGWLEGGALQPIENQFIDSLNSKKLDWTNFYTFYQGLVERLIALQTARHTGHFQLDEKASRSDAAQHHKEQPDRQTILHDIKHQEEKQVSLKAKLKKETQFNRRLELNMQIKHCQQQIQQLTIDL